MVVWKCSKAKTLKYCRCALAPPDESVQKAFGECEKELKIDPKQRFINSCNCLKSAGVNINCDLQ